MRRLMSIVMAAALTLGLTGAAMAQDWRADGRMEPRSRGFHAQDDYGYRSNGRGDARNRPWMRARIRAARVQLRRTEWLARRDGVVTRWERVRIHRARMRLAWLMQRAYGGGWGSR